MKNTIRILSLVICLAMLVGVFAASSFAAEEKVYAEMIFAEQPAAGVAPWSADYHTDTFSWVAGTPAATANSQHVKLTHNAANTDRVLLGYALKADYSDLMFEYEKIGAKDLTFDTKITDGAKLMIEFYIIWDLLDGYGSEDESAARRVTVWVENNKVYDGINQVQVGEIPANVDLSKWHTYTVRCSRANGVSGDYNVDLMIDGVSYVSSHFIMSNQGTGSAPRDRFAIHARTPGAVEIDNIKIAEMYLDEPLGAITSGTYNVVWQTDFGAPGTALTFSDQAAGEAQFTDGKFAYPNAHENTELTLVTDDPPATDTSGYLKASRNGSQRYANFVMDEIIPDGVEKFWIQSDIKLNGEGIGYQVGFPFNDNGTLSGRQLFVEFRPDGLYYNTGSDFVKADFEMPALTDWTKVIFEVDVAAQEATVYVNGTALGKVYPRNLSYSATGTNYTQFKITTTDNGLTGEAFIDNIKVTSGVSPIRQPGATADASIIGLAAMMLPVSGIGLGALCMKRKKEN